MARASANDPVVLLGDQDRTEYLGLVNEWVADGRLPRDIAIPWIYQLYTMADVYIGVVLVVDSLSIVHRTSGPEPAFRKWLVADATWENEYLYGDISSFYRGLVTNIVKAVECRFIYKYDQYYENNSRQYEQIVNHATMDVTRYAAG